MDELPSGYVKIAMAWKMAIELVDFPWKIVIFYSYVKLPEGMIFNDEICVTTIASLRITFFRIRKDCG